MRSSLWKVFALLLPILGMEALAEWRGWHTNAWSPLRGSVETVEVFGVSASFVLTNWPNGSALVETQTVLASVYPTSNGTSVVSTIPFWITPATGGLHQITYTVTNRHRATNQVVMNREIVAVDCVRAALERNAALCGTELLPPVLYRAERDNLVWNKQWLKLNIPNFVETNLPFAPLTVTGLLARYNLPTNYLDQTPWRQLFCGDTGLTMIVTARVVIVETTNITTNVYLNACGQTVTNIGTGGVFSVVCTNDTPFQGIDLNASAWGWCGITNLYNALQVTKAQGTVPAECGGRTNISEHRSDFYTCVTNFEAGFSDGISAALEGFPLHEARHFNPGTNVTYQGYEVMEGYNGDCFVPSLVTTTAWALCYIPNNYTSGGPCAVDRENRYYYYVTNTISSGCDPAYACTPGLSCLNFHVAPISFANCTNRAPTNVTYIAEEWYNSGATGTCAGASATFNDALALGLSPTGWATIFTYDSTNWPADICRTNLAIDARVPWAGSTDTNPVAWAVYDAVLIKRWRFQHR